MNRFKLFALAFLMTGTVYAACPEDNFISCLTLQTSPTAADLLEIEQVSDNTSKRITIGGLAGRQTIPVSVLYMRPTVSNGAGWHQSVETTAGRPDMVVMDFDAAADEHVQFSIPFSNAWNRGTLTYRVHWTTTATDTDGVAWALQAVAISNDDTINVVYGTPIVVTDDAISAAEDELVTAESAALTVAGTPADGDMVYFRFFRDVDDGNDDMTEKGRLISIDLFITTDALNDV